MYIHKTPGWLKFLYPGLLWDHFGENDRIYLTFDDGPVPEVTPFVLDQLERFGAKATFFCVGENVSRNPELYQQLVNAGHSWGNHTYNHLNGWRSPDPDYLENIQRCQELLAEDDEKPMFRPPYGRIKRSQIRRLKSDYRIVMWDLLTGDFDAEMTPEKCLETSIRLTRPGSIVIFHDSQKSWQNLQFVLPRYLEYFQQREFLFPAL